MMKGGIAGLMKQAQQMQDNMKKAQEQLTQIEVEGQSGAGMVKVLVTCAHDVRRVSIDEVRELQGAHGMRHAELHDRVDLLYASNTLE